MAASRGEIGLVWVGLDQFSNQTGNFRFEKNQTEPNHRFENLRPNQTGRFTVRFGLDRRFGFFQFGGSVWFGLGRFGLIFQAVWIGLGRFGLVYGGLGRFGLVYGGLGRFGLVYGGLVRFGSVWFGLGWFDKLKYI